MKILIIDNDLSTVKTLEALILNRENFNIHVALSGKEGLEELMRDPNYDLVLVDIMMPEIGGMEVCKKMTNNLKLKNVPVLLMSSALPISSEEYKTTLKNSTSFSVVKGVIEKPFVIDDLLAKIKKITKIDF